MNKETLFKKYPDRDPQTKKSIKIGGDQYKKLVKQYGTPKIKSPKTGRKIGVNRTEYKNLLKEGYSQHELLYGKLEEYPALPTEIVNQITKSVNQPDKRLINKYNLRENAEMEPVETLPKELVDEILYNTNVPVKRLINKQYKNEVEPMFRKVILNKIYKIVKNNVYNANEYNDTDMTEDEFRADQIEQIENLTDDQIEFINMLIKNKKNLIFMDEEYSTEYLLDDFFLDDGKIIFVE
jgi:hypothetical protein